MTAPQKKACIIFNGDTSTTESVTYLFLSTNQYIVTFLKWYGIIW